MKQKSRACKLVSLVVYVTMCGWKKYKEHGWTVGFCCLPIRRDVRTLR